MATEIYVVKVLLKRGVWRRIQIGSKHTLYDLHKTILEAFGFSEDHLYAFFMEGKPWQGEAYWSQDNDEGPYANKIKIESLDLEVKRKFLYLYDFGDEWRFEVQIEKIVESEIVLLKPVVVEIKGESPEQY